MQNGLYVATSGMLMQEQRVNVVTNNLANMSTNGFKKELAIFSNYRPVDTRQPQNAIQQSLYNKTINSSVRLDDIVTSFESGYIKPTENSFDMALATENTFFSVETPWGIRYTRDGEFTLNNNGELVTRDGFNLIDRNTGAPITVNMNEVSSFSVLTDGSVYVNNELVSQIETAYFDEPEYLQKVGRNLYEAVGVLPEQVDDAGIMQGYVEASNVNAITEMVQMVEAMRGFEMYQKVIQAYDAVNEQAASSIAKV